MKITTLIENTAHNKLLSEHGLSLLVEYKGYNILVDTGASDKFITNSKNLDMDLSQVDYVIISHNHYDHIGGLKSFLQVNTTAKVFIRDYAFTSEFHRLNQGGSSKKLSYDWQEFRGYEERFVRLDDSIQLIDGVRILFTNNPREEYLSQDREMIEVQGEDISRDRFLHELFVSIDHDDHSVIISSCSHNGIINIIEQAKTSLNKPISHFIGGLHMKGRDGMDSLNCPIDFVSLNARYLQDNILGNVYTGHCTGLRAYKIIESILTKRIEYLHTGKVIRL